MIRLKSLIEESNQGLWNWYKSQLPTWPDYVIKDMIYTKLKNTRDLEDKKEHIEYFKKEFPNLKWKLENLDITFDKFSKNTQKVMKSRDMGRLNPSEVPNDEERHKTQMNLIKKRGISKQPIIVIKKPDGYDLWEGWHRTMQALQVFPEGYKCRAWVGYSY